MVFLRVLCMINFLKVVLLNISKRQNLKSPSFPHALSGNPDEFGTGPPIETFGGDALKTILMA
jgi:hypothetical protein